MNSTNLQPLVQDPSNGFHEYDAHKDAEDLIGTCSSSELTAGFLLLPSGMPSFIQDEMAKVGIKDVDYGTTKKPFRQKVNHYYIHGRIKHAYEGDLYCPCCNSKLVNNGTSEIELNHTPYNCGYSSLIVQRQRMICSNPECSYNWTEPLDFKAHDHRITVSLENMVRDLLAQGYTLKEISLLTGLHKNTVKAIDKKRLQDKYTIDGKELKKPTEFSEYLGIDEFLLHKGYKYATIIIDLKTGHVLNLYHGKKKQCVYDFVDWVGIDWMKHVKAIACDMNTDYADGFMEKCPWIKVVYDHFHLVKNFNDKVIAEVRKDIQAQLIAEGRVEDARSLKHTKYVLMTTEETRKKKEKDAKKEKVVSKGNELFNKPEVKQKAGIKDEYEKLISENKLLFIADYVKDQLDKAYKTTSERGMKIHINRIIKNCKATENKHFLWFANLLESHYDGIISHAKMPISSGKVEGTNQMIKTLRRKSYGYPDDEYFFLKIMDSSRRFSEMS